MISFRFSFPIIVLGVLFLSSSIAVSAFASSADLAVTLETPVLAGLKDTLTFTAVITNNGPDSAVNVTLWNVTDHRSMSFAPDASDLFCAERSEEQGTVMCLIDSLAPGATKRVHISHIIDRCDPNTATGAVTVRAYTTDPLLSNNASGNKRISLSCSRVDEHYALAIPDPKTSRVDVSLSVSGPLRAASGGTIALSITVANRGPDAAENVTVHQRYNTALVSLVSGQPEVTCTPKDGEMRCVVGTLAKGAKKTFTLTYRVQGCSALPLRQAFWVDTTSVDLGGESTRNTMVTTAIPCAGSSKRVRTTSSVKAPVAPLLSPRRIRSRLSS